MDIHVAMLGMMLGNRVKFLHLPAWNMHGIYVDK